jgi:hypothetical protein
MKIRTFPSQVFLSLAILGIALVAGLRAQAPARGGQQQQPPAQRVVVQVTHVKFDQLDAYQNLMKSTFLPVVKKANLAAYVWTWTSGASGEAGEFVQVRPIKNYAELDIPNRLRDAMGAEALNAFNAKIRPMIASRQNYIQTVRQDLTLQASAAPPALGVVQIFQVSPGKGADFTASMTSDYLPAFRKAGVKDFFAYAGNFGGAGGNIVTVRPIAKYAQLDEPGLLNKAGLSQDQIQKIGQRRAATATVVENNLVRFVPELSYGMPPKVAP